MSMKHHKILLALSLMAGVVTFANATDGDEVSVAGANEGSVTFTGSIKEAACSIDADSVNQTVQLGQIASAALANGGTSTPKPFTIKLENCSLATAKSVTTTFTGSPGSGKDSLLGITGTAKGASIVLTDGSGNAMKLGQASATRTLQEGTNTLTYSAFLKGDGGDAATIVPGDFQGVANFMLAYQ